MNAQDPLDFLKDQMLLTKWLNDHPEVPKAEFIVSGNKIARRILLPDCQEAAFYLSEIVKCRTPVIADATVIALNIAARLVAWSEKHPTTREVNEELLEIENLAREFRKRMDAQ